VKSSASFVKREAVALASAFSFFSRVPVPLRTFEPERAAFYLPLVGYALGGFLVGSGLLLSRVFDSWLTSALLLALQYYLANYFHFDGLLDTADALSAPVSKEKRLAILKTPEVGVLGFLFGFFFLLTEFLLFHRLIEAGLWWGVALRPAAGRLTMALVGFLGEAAKREGLGALFLRRARWRFLSAQIFWAPVFFFFPLAGFVTMLLALPILLHFRCSFGGLTGDLLGASEELAEWVFTAVLVVGLNPGVW
jgi:adenosylcobinamide-GDP ribazoletransferase